MNNKFIFLILTFLLFIVTMPISSAKSEIDTIVQDGIKFYNVGDYLNCAIKMELLKNDLSKFSSSSKSKINFYRSVCNGKLGYYSFVLPLINEIVISDLSPEQRKYLENFKKEMQIQVFKIGFNAALENNFITCATQMELIKIPSDLFSSKSKNRILFYRTYCNKELGYKAFALSLFEDISLEDLTVNESKIYAKMQEDLKKELELKHKIYTYLTLYTGTLDYSPKVTNARASLYGLSSSFIPADGGWNINLGLEKVNLTLVDTANNYSQTQANVTIGKNIWNNFSITPFLTIISTSNSGSSDGGNEGHVIGVMGSYINSLTSKISLEYDYSVYPSFIIGNTTAAEYSISWDKTLITNKYYTAATKLLIESIQPQASILTDPNTGFSLKSHYERYALDLNLFFKKYQLGFSAWTGAEALGVRNLGSLVFNALEERSQGIGANIKFEITPSASFLKFAYSRETILNPNGSPIQAASVVGALTFIF